MSKPLVQTCDVRTSDDSAAARWLIPSAVIQPWDRWLLICCASLIADIVELLVELRFARHNTKLVRTNALYLLYSMLQSSPEGHLSDWGKLVTLCKRSLCASSGFWSVILG
jgi:hypothetical protein